MLWIIIKKKCAERYFYFKDFFYKSNCKQVYLGANVGNIGFVFYVIQRHRQRGKIMKRESRGIDNFLRDQGSKFPSLPGSGIKILTKITGSFTKKYTS